MGESFGKILKSLREERGMSQQALAETLKVKRSTIGNYEQGTRSPDMETLEVIADYFNVDMDFLYGKTAIPNRYRWEKAPQTAIDAGIATNKGAVRIPVLSEIAAGVPIEAMNYALDDADPDTWEEIPAEWLHGDRQYFALRVSGDSMEPKIEDGAIAIIERCYEFIDNRIMAVYVNGYNATLKRVRLKDNGMIMLEAFNPTYGAQIFTAEEIENLPVRPCGILRETRTTW